MANKGVKQTLIGIPGVFSDPKKDLVNMVRSSELHPVAIDDWRNMIAGYPALAHLAPIDDDQCRQAVENFLGQIYFSPNVLAGVDDLFCGWCISHMKPVAGTVSKLGDIVVSVSANMEAQLARVASTFDFNDFLLSIEFEGFNRGVVRATAVEMIGMHGALMIALLGCYRTVNLNRVQEVRILATKTINGVSILQPMTIGQLSATGVLVEKAAGKSPQTLSVARIAAAFPLEVAYLGLKSGRIPKRFDDLLTPGWLQFPSAASLELPGLHQMGWLFQREFSKAVKGTISAQLYKSIRKNPIKRTNANSNLWDKVLGAWLCNNPQMSCDFAEAGTAAKATNNFWESFEKGNGSRLRKSMGGYKVPVFNGAKYDDLPVVAADEDDD